MRTLTAALLLALGACQAPVPDSPPSLFRGTPVEPAGTDVRLLASAIEDTLTSPDSLILRYTIRNEGPPQAFRDHPDNYAFRVFTADGIELEPEYFWAMTSASPSDSYFLGTGDTTRQHMVNLACLQRHETSFDPHFPRDRPDNCSFTFRLPKRGYYFATGQYFRTGTFDSTTGDPDIRASLADTVLFYYDPE
jgi:hypothetical protein